MSEEYDESGEEKSMEYSHAFAEPTPAASVVNPNGAEIFQKLQADAGGEFPAGVFAKVELKISEACKSYQPRENSLTDTAIACLLNIKVRQVLLGDAQYQSLLLILQEAKKKRDAMASPTNPSQMLARAVHDLCCINF